MALTALVVAFFLVAALIGVTSVVLYMRKRKRHQRSRALLAARLDAPSSWQQMEGRLRRSVPPTKSESVPSYIEREHVASYAAFTMPAPDPTPYTPAPYTPDPSPSYSTESYSPCDYGSSDSGGSCGSFD